MMEPLIIALGCVWVLGRRGVIMRSCLDLTLSIKKYLIIYFSQKYKKE